MTPAAVIAASTEHLPGIAATYAAAVDSGPATFDLEAPTLEWWGDVLQASDPSAGLLLLVAVDQAGAVLGYAKTGRFRPKAAYDSTRETSVYVADGARGRGIGHALYAELLARLDRCGLRLAVAGVTDPNPASARLHRAHGFRRVGTFSGVGFKFGAPWDVTWYERPLRSAILLDQLRDAASSDGSQTDAATRALTILRGAGSYPRVRLFELRGDELELVAEAATDGAEALPRSSILANSRGLDGQRAHIDELDGRVRARAAVIEPLADRPLGLLEVHAANERRFDSLDAGLIGRCAEALLPLWQDLPTARR